MLIESRLSVPSIARPRRKSMDRWRIQEVVRSEVRMELSKRKEKERQGEKQKSRDINRDPV